VVRKLDVSTPSPELVSAYMVEIAKGYGIKWSAPNAEGSTQEDAVEENAAVSHAQYPVRVEHFM
jgi:hypothetical protein